MLGRLGSSINCVSAESMPRVPSRYERNEIEDMKIAIGYLYEFKKKLDELHPACIDAIDNMLQRPRY